jgi:ribosome-binding ATPase
MAIIKWMSIYLLKRIASPVSSSNICFSTSSGTCKEYIMGFNCGIIGLPNVGKSTIFNALSGAGAAMENYPFCTIEPNKGIVPVPDERLLTIAKILDKHKPIPTRIEFIDVAGLVKGASKGEGLGNKFLGNIRQVDAILHIVRCFSSQDVVHVTGDVDPVRDIEIVNTELILADMEILERAREKYDRLSGHGQKDAKTIIAAIDAMLAFLNDGKLLKSFEMDETLLQITQEYGLITHKPILYCANIDEKGIQEDLLANIDEYAHAEGSESMFLCGKIEEEISELPEEEKGDFLSALGLKESGLTRVIHNAYRLLDLITYYTTTTDLQAWTLKKGTSAVKAAGKIHTDFERGFIRAEVFGFQHLVDSGSEKTVREKGHLRLEGRDYIVHDGDIIKYLFNV